MRLCELKGRFLFEADPGWQIVDGERRIADRAGAAEIATWSAYYEMEQGRSGH